MKGSSRVTSRDLSQVFISFLCYLCLVYTFFFDIDIKNLDWVYGLQAYRPRPRPKPGQAKPYFWLLAWLMILPGPSRLKPGQSRGFQAKPEPAHHYICG